ncbi:LOW QUALITY PROTEIN: uncharacterized protein LOC134810961 [Bolinopsis microptera]|uniref:LOW QUALITY PROTEIN: uncharacterized protein LOC134810961 n=1 Tax=Bolinopsis microptera TaxID=2820187 RepID=UPI003078AF20
MNRPAALRANPSGEIAVKFDGTYQTRGFSSKVAVVWISNADTDEILDFVIQSKKCFTCDQYSERSSAPMHECTSNYIGSSCEMERKAAVEMFEQSRSFNLTYRALVSDGDSKSYIDVFGIYGICKQCMDNKQKFTNLADASFTEWVKSESYTDWCESQSFMQSCNQNPRIAQPTCVAEHTEAQVSWI